MCRFCVQHGDGETWYLQAQNYAADLESDLRRRGYIVDFVQGFERMRSRALLGARAIDIAPRPLSSAVKRSIQERQQEHHFGQPVPIEECERIFGFATSIVRLPCVCRTHARTPDRGYCIAVTARPMDDVLAEAFSGYADCPDTAGLERMTGDQAMELLRDCEREGLMHSVWTFITPFIGAICNCDLKSGCMAMGLTVGHDIKVMWKGEYVAELDATACTGCGACVERCPFGAIDAPPERHRPATLRQKDCYGCGVCRSACRPDAIGLLGRAAVPVVSHDW
jgi:NAD-dependent dihydropyrimidine dehydrogenase PreA subunit